SFVTVENAHVRKRSASAFPHDLYAKLPEPNAVLPDRTYNVLVTGIGGTGVVTVGAVVGMAAHVEGKACAILDSTGLAQKNGSVLSHLRIAKTPDNLFSSKIPVGQADALLACDMVTAVNKEAMSTLGKDRTRAVINEHVTPTANFVLDPDIEFDPSGLKQRVTRAVGNAQVDMIDAPKLALALMGDAIATNFLILGFAFQRGLIPLSRAA